MKKTKKTNNPDQNQSFRETLAEASKEVDNWPLWKKEALGITSITAKSHDNYMSSSGKRNS